MKHPLLAGTAAVAAFLVAAGSLGPLWTTVAVAAVLVLVVSFGWPQMLGAPARKSLTAVLSLTGVAAAVATALWFGPEPGEGSEEFGASLIEPIGVAIALGVIAAFMVQLFRGSGSPQRLESTAGTIAGVAAVCCGAGWVALARFEAGPLMMTTGLALVLAALVGMIPFGRAGSEAGAGVAAVLSVVLAGAVPWVMAALWPAAVPGLSVPAAVVSGALAGLVLVLLARLAPRDGHGRPEGLRATLALGVAPVAVVGLVTYFVFRIMPV